MAEQRRSIYRGRIIDVGVERVVLPNGRVTDLEIVRHPGGAAVVALDDAGRLCLLRQFRHAAQGWIWELPAGKIDAGESPIVTAQRELLEEAGVSAETWESLGRMISSPGVFTEVIHLYEARELSSGAPLQTEEHEVLEVHWVPWLTAINWACQGEIIDAKTLVGLFRMQAKSQILTEP